MTCLYNRCIRNPIWLAALAFSLSTLACWSSASVMNLCDAVGIWKGVSETKGITLSSTLTLNSDHTFEAVDFPLVLIKYEGKITNASVSGHGTWNLQKQDGGEQHLDLDFDDLFYTVSGEKFSLGTSLETEGLSKKYRLYHWIGDLDNGDRYYFVRDKKDCETK